MSFFPNNITLNGQFDKLNSEFVITKNIILRVVLIFPNIQGFPSKLRIDRKHRVFL